MVIVFTGHRDQEVSGEQFLALAEEFPGALWRLGGARDGFDQQADNAAHFYHFSHGTRWKHYLPRYGQKPAEDSPDRLPLLWTEKYRGAAWVRVAPLKRNEAMVDGREGEGPATLCIAAWDGRKTGGTYYTKCFAEWRGVPVRVWEPAQ